MTLFTSIWTCCCFRGRIDLVDGLYTHTHGGECKPDYIDSTVEYEMDVSSRDTPIRKEVDENKKCQRRKAGEKKRDEKEAAQSDWIVSSAPFHFHFLE